MMQILSHGNSKGMISLILVLIVLCGGTFSAFRLLKNAQINRFVNEFVTYAMNLEESNQAEINGLAVSK